MIIYFSGTGNSYSVANELAAALNDRAEPLIRLQEEPDVFENQYRHPEVEMKDLFLR